MERARKRERESRGEGGEIDRCIDRERERGGVLIHKHINLTSIALAIYDPVACISTSK